MYDRIETHVFIRDPKRTPLGYDNRPTLPGGFSAKLAKEFLGWQSEADYAEILKKEYTPTELKNLDQTFGDNYLFTDRNGDKVRCRSNLHNRPFDSKLAEAWMLEMLRGKWQFNGESMVIDEKGMTQDCQHRMVALVWAEQEWLLDAAKAKPEQQWQVFWKVEPVIDCLIVLGIDDRDEVINTQNTGKPRSLADALYRHSWFANQPPKDRERLAKIAQWAVRLLWDRTDAKANSLAPRRPHSESFEFIENHSKLLKCVKFISEEADGKKLSPYLPLGYAAALMYLMGCSRSDSDKYIKVGTEKALDWTLYEKVEEFFVLFCSKSAAMEPLVNELEGIPEDSGRWGNDLRIGLFIKAWHIWSGGKKLTKEKLEIATTTNEDGQLVLSEKPRCGGIDVEHSDPIEDDASLVDGGAVECLKGGNHKWKTEEGETFCSKCFDPAPKPKRRGK